MRRQRIDISNFLGIVTGVDKLDMKQDNAIDAQNVYFSKPGFLNSLSGYTKQETTAAAGEIDAIFQMNETIFVLSDGAWSKQT